MFNQQFFVEPNVFHTGSSLDGYSLVTGATQLTYGAKLLGFITMNSGGDGYVQVHDGYAQPTNASVPLVSIKALSGTQVSLDCSVFSCVPVRTGIVIALSTTGSTYTAGAATLWTTAFWLK